MRSFLVSLDAALLIDGRGGVLDSYLSMTRHDDERFALMSLAKAISTNPLWTKMDSACLVGRVHPAPLLAVFGNFSRDERERLYDLSTLLHRFADRHRYIDYFAAEAAADNLAKMLMMRFGKEALMHFRFTAIPRGGWIVLGMLSYMLDLRPEQLVTGRSEGGPDFEALVIVDDCALSGVRFRQFLGKIDDARVIFCPLFAPAELCRAIEEAEPRVEACISAEDLYDFAPERFGEGYSRWCATQRERMGRYGYWDGIPEHIAFSWCEPQTKYWNTETEQYEASWNLIPPHLSLKQRYSAANPERADEGGYDGLTFVADGPGPLRAADRVLWTQIDSEIAVARMPEGTSQTTPCFRLEGTAADMWRCVLEQGTLDAAEAALLLRYDVEPATLRHDLAAFVSDLENNGILTRR
ncbi:PqqD family protein [Litchfieldella rifensis]|uniref:PqqD family protein n=1 Tax=Litchfieldella rifensis TaxID=762643 RepID=A0ABV7LSW5_9GAMM